MSDQVVTLARSIETAAGRLARLAANTDYSGEVFDRVEPLHHALWTLLDLLTDPETMAERGWQKPRKGA